MWLYKFIFIHIWFVINFVNFSELKNIESCLMLIRFEFETWNSVLVCVWIRVCWNWSHVSFIVISCNYMKQRATNWSVYIHLNDGNPNKMVAYVSMCCVIFVKEWNVSKEKSLLCFYCFPVRAFHRFRFSYVHFS